MVTPLTRDDLMASAHSYLRRADILLRDADNEIERLRKNGDVNPGLLLQAAKVGALMSSACTALAAEEEITEVLTEEIFVEGSAVPIATRLFDGFVDRMDKGEVL